LPEQEEEDFLLWPEHEDALDLFMRCQTQWRVGGLGQVTGFCYESVIALANIYKYDDLKTVLDDLQVMEIRAIEILNKEQK
tara:strand:+ start:870 stop:1112 length:243 start_codon:yes stop_codon:yes gene_type:complete